MAYTYNEEQISRLGGVSGSHVFVENQDTLATKAQAVAAAAGRANYPGAGSIVLIKCTDGVVTGVVESDGSVTA